MLHAHKIPNVSGVSDSAFFIAAPIKIPLSCLREEVIGNFLNVGLLVSHLMLVIMVDLSHHLVHSMLDFVSVMIGCLFIWPVFPPVFQMASSIFGALTFKSMMNVMVQSEWSSMHLFFSLKACNQCVGITITFWFSPISESTNQLSRVMDSFNLTSCDIIYHSFGCLVEMFGNLMSCLLMWFVLEPIPPFLCIVIIRLPVSGDWDISVVWVRLLNINATLFPMFQLSFICTILINFTRNGIEVSLLFAKLP